MVQYRDDVEGYIHTPRIASSLSSRVDRWTVGTSICA
jgi:hypothetical protein